MKIKINNLTLSNYKVCYYQSSNEAYTSLDIPAQSLLKEFEIDDNDLPRIESAIEIFGGALEISKNKKENEDKLRDKNKSLETDRIKKVTETTDKEIKEITKKYNKEHKNPEEREYFEVTVEHKD